MKNVRAFLIDLDGVIIPYSYHYLAWKQACDDFSIPYTKEQSVRQKGVSHTTSLDIVLENSPREFTEEEKTKLRQRKNQYYQNYIDVLNPNKVIFRADEALSQAKELGITCILCSSNYQAKDILKKIGLEDKFASVFDPKSLNRFKPNPEIYLKACESIHLSPCECLVIEDSYPTLLETKKCSFNPCYITDYPGENNDGILEISALTDIFYYLD